MGNICSSKKCGLSYDRSRGLWNTRPTYGCSQPRIRVNKPRRGKHGLDLITVKENNCYLKITLFFYKVFIFKTTEYIFLNQHLYNQPPAHPHSIIYNLHIFIISSKPTYSQHTFIKSTTYTSLHLLRPTHPVTDMTAGENAYLAQEIFFSFNSQPIQNHTFDLFIVFLFKKYRVS